MKDNKTISIIERAQNKLLEAASAPDEELDQIVIEAKRIIEQIPDAETRTEAMGVLERIGRNRH